MIFGIGTDIVDIKRIEKSIEKFGDSFISKIFTKKEQENAIKKAFPAASYAKKFAAKEAVSKAIGTGIGKHVSWQNIEISHTPEGQPKITLLNATNTYLVKKIPQDMNYKVDISLSDEPPYAQAFAIISLERKQ